MERALDRFRTELKSLNKSGEIRVVTQQASAELVAPLEVVLEESEGEIWLKYRLPFGGKTRHPQGALAEFLSLAEERTAPEQFLRFAQQWGVHWICKHKVVATHHPLCFPR